MNDVQRVHSLFRGSSELSKRTAQVAAGGEVVATIIAVQGIWHATSSELGIWRPLLAFGLLVVAALLRGVSDRCNQFGQKCRRLSLHAFAFGTVLHPATVSGVVADAPFLAVAAGRKLPAQTLDLYYEPTCEIGEPRFRELVAHSAYFSWRLMRTCTSTYGLMAAALIVPTCCLIYGLAALTTTEINRGAVLDGLFSIVLGAVGLRLMALCFSSATSAGKLHEIADELVRNPLPEGEALRWLVEEYDIDRSCGPAAPTGLYRLYRTELAKEWSLRRRALTG